MVRLLVQGNSFAVTHLCNLFWVGALFASMALDFTHLSNGDMCHKVSVISAVHTCNTQPHTCSGCCEVFSWTRKLMATLTLRVSALTYHGRSSAYATNVLEEKIATQGLCELLNGE